MEKVPIYPKQELAELQAFKQNNRKVFDSNFNNERRLLEIKKLKHNYERSQAMLNSVLLTGFDDSAATVNTIIKHLLDIGQSINEVNCKNYKSKIVSHICSLDEQITTLHYSLNYAKHFLVYDV